MTPLLVLGVVAACIVALADYKKGLLLVAAGGLLQDPIRKTSEGQSPFLLGVVLALFGATLLGALLKSPPFWWRRKDWSRLRQPVALFGVVLAIQGVITFVRTGSPVLIVIGLAAYLGPVAAVMLGSWVGTGKLPVRRFLLVYVGVVAIMASGLVLWQVGYRWAILQSVGEGLTTYSWDLGAIVLPSGFFRVPEVASWHCATAACVCLILAASRKPTPFQWAFYGGLVTFFAWGTLVTGRRKGLAEIILFFAFFALLQLWVRGRLGRFGPAAAGVVAVGVLAFQQYDLGRHAEVQIDSMRDRSAASAGVVGRMAASVTSLPRIVEAAGFLGTGLGTGTQGAQHFRTRGERWAKISESGLARIVAELGVPGAVVALYLLVRFFLEVRRRMPVLGSEPAVTATPLLGLIALLGANGIIFVSAHQIFGDPFVYIFLGLTLGFVVAGLDTARRETLVASEQRAAA